MNHFRFTTFLHKCLPIIYFSFFLSLFCGFRVLSSTCTGVILGFTLLFTIADSGQFIKSRRPNYFVIGCAIFYLLQLAALGYTKDLATGIVQIEVKITLLFIPVALYYSPYLNRDFRNKIMPYYLLLLSFVMIFCLGAAAQKYLVGHDPSVFFHYALVSPFNLHAIYFSIFTFVALIYLLEGVRRQIYFLNKFFHFFTITGYIFIIILLASKMVIIFTFLSILIYFRLSVKNSGFFKTGFAIIVAVSSIIIIALMLTTNPVSSRFKDIFHGKIDLIEQNHFTPGVYFNGVQFRLLQWKLVAEILNEQKAWILGVSPGDAQNLLDKKYSTLNMYVGNRSLKSHGYLKYNTHDEFLESTLQNGIIGLIVFLFICLGLIRMMMHSDNTELWLTGTLLLVYCFLESIFQTQYGVLIFTFYPLLLYCTTEKHLSKKSVTSIT